MKKALIQACIKKVLPFFLTVALAVSCVQASHFMGADITYKAISNLKFEVTLKVYRDCRGVPMGNPSNFGVRCSTGGSMVAVSMTKISIRDISPRCKGASGICNPQNTTISAAGVEEHTFTGVIDFNVGTLNTAINNGCCKFTIEYEECCRNGAINTGSPGNFYVYSTIDVCRAPMNNSPQYTVDPVVFLCCNVPFYYNSGALDTLDGDSLAFELAIAGDGPGTNFSYGGGYSANKPLTPYLPGDPNMIVPHANPPIGFYLDPAKGDLIFTPTGCTEIGPVAIRTNEYRKDSTGTWRLIGQQVRDLQLNVKQCTGNNPPKLSVSSGYDYVVCLGQTVCFQVEVTDQQFVLPPPASSAPPDSIDIQWNHGVGNGVLTTDPYTVVTPSTNGAISSRAANFCWTPTSADVGAMPHRLVISAADQSCNTSSPRITRAVSIMVKDNITGQRSVKTDSCGNLFVVGDSSSGFSEWSWKLKDMSGTDLGNTVVNRNSSTFRRDTFYFWKPGKYIVESGGKHPRFCVQKQYDTVDISMLDTIPYFTFESQGMGFKTFKFTPTLVDSAYSYLWDFGDGTTSTAKIPVHTYTAFNDYEVCLTISYGSCSRKICYLFNWWGKPELSSDLVIRAYPNPFDKKLDLLLNLPNSSEISIALLDLTGRVLFSTAPEKAGAGEFKRSLDPGDAFLPNGVYLLRVKINGNDTYLRILKTDQTQ